MTQNGLLIARPTPNTSQPPHSKALAGGLYPIQSKDGACGVCETCGVRVLRRGGRQEEKEEEEEEGLFKGGGGGGTGSLVSLLAALP